MGMFDSLFDAKGDEWQTKAFDLVLAEYRIGDALRADDKPADYQVEILGSPAPRVYVDSYATVRGGKLASVNDARDMRLPLYAYFGEFVESAEA